ncbi:integrase [Burkholderia sp. KK1]|nr:integrase [Burkholderia sp. KK1]
MKQAKTLNDKELKQVLTYISLHWHAARNRTMLLLTHWAGMRVGEVAALKVGDVLNPDTSIRSEIRLAAEQTKGRQARTVFIGQRLRKELASYVATLKHPSAGQRLFATQKRAGFSASTLCQYFHWLYRYAGIDGASSHSGRRSFITNLANKGGGVRVLMSLAGHRNISTTQRYIYVNDDMPRRAVDLI